MSELKRAVSADSDVKLRTYVGGQALIEGIMMRGRYNWAVAIRQPDGTIYTEEHDLASGRDKNSWLRWPVIRGCTAFVESLVLGFKALNISSEHAYDWSEEEEGEGSGDKAVSAEPLAADVAAPAVNASATAAGAVAPAEKLAAPAGDSAIPTEKSVAPAKEVVEEEKENSESGMGAWMLVSTILGIVLGIAIFMVAPAWISNLILGESAMNTAAWNVLDGIIRVAIFIAYIWAISLMKDINRMFCYHGAEHKTIHCFEHGLPLTPENAMQFPRLHVRCGTAFMIMVMIVAIFVYTALGNPINSLVDLTGVTEGPLRFVLVVFVRILFLPLIAGLSYEVTVKWAGSHPSNPLVRIVLWPGLQMQRLTTNPPDESMLECAIAAMQLVLAREEAEAQARALQNDEAAAGESLGDASSEHEAPGFTTRSPLPQKQAIAAHEEV